MATKSPLENACLDAGLFASTHGKMVRLYNAHVDTTEPYNTQKQMDRILAGTPLFEGDRNHALEFAYRTRDEQLREAHITLDGRRACILVNNRDRRFVTVATLPQGPRYEWTRESAEHILRTKNGAFRS